MVCLTLQVTFAFRHSNGPVINMPNQTLLMIRPLAQALDFVQALTVLTGKMPITLYSPVIKTHAIIAEPPKKVQFLLFSSVNGVKFFSSQIEERTIPTLCVGDSTAKAAADAGFSTQSAGGTASDLLELVKSVADPAQGPLIYVCGATVAYDLDGELAKIGFSTKRCVVYEQIPHALTKKALSTLLTPTVVPVLSPNTARIFAEQTAGMELSKVTFVFISENACTPLSHVKARKVLASSPTRDAMIRAISRFL